MVDVLHWVVLGLGGQVAGPISQGLVVGDDHAPAAGGDDLVAVEAEAGQAAFSPHQPALVPGPQGLGGVLDEGQAVLLGRLTDGVQVDRVAQEVDRQDGPDPPAGGLVVDAPVFYPAVLVEKVNDPLRVHLQMVWLYVEEDRPGVQVADGVGRGDEGQSREDDLVPGSDPG